MRINNKKVNDAIERLEAATNCNFDLRDDNVRPDLYSEKYFLYKVTDLGVRCDGTYGRIHETFKTQKEFVEWVNEYLAK